MRRSLGTAAALLASALAFAQGAPTQGEVRKIDKAGGKITLKHGEIRHLDLPAMNMTFRVRDPALLERLQVGDKVAFTADRIDGAYTITSLQPAR